MRFAYLRYGYEKLENIAFFVRIQLLFYCLANFFSLALVFREEGVAKRKTEIRKFWASISFPKITEGSLTFLAVP